jgi:hypothetical protein
MATYYVKTTGSSDSYNGLYPDYVSGNDGPWLTLAKAVSGISSGDTVYFRSGTWQDERLDIEYQSYTSLTTFARYPSDAVGSVIFDGTDLTPQTYDDGIIFVKSTNYVKIDGIKVQNFSKCGICFVTSTNSKIVNCISDTTGSAGIIVHYFEDGEIQYNKIYNSNLHTWGTGLEEMLSVASWSTNVDVSYNELYAGNRTLGWTGGEGLNIKAGSTYIYVHDNYVDMARPDEQENDRYCMGVDGWEQDTHHIYFWNNTVKNGSWGIQFNSEEGAAADPDTGAHHLYAWNNLIIHIGHGSMHGGGIGMPSYGTSPGKCDYCYWWNNTVYDCYYGALFNKDEIAAPIEVTNNIFDNCESTVIAYGGGVNQELITLTTNLTSGVDPHFLNEGELDFHLTADSTNCIDQGTTLSGPSGPPTDVTVDYDGVARPQGSAFDIGAYEYESVVKIRLVYATRA